MPPAAPVITATCPLIVCILTAPPEGASRVPTLRISRPGSSMVLGIMEFMNQYTNSHASRLAIFCFCVTLFCDCIKRF